MNLFRGRKKKVTDEIPIREFLMSSAKAAFEEDGHSMSQRTITETLTAYICPRGCTGVVIANFRPTPTCKECGTRMVPA